MHIVTSNDMKVLEDAFECILILAFSSLAAKNYYDWYKIIHIDNDGIVHDGFNKDGWAIKYTYSGDYKTKLIYLEFGDTMLYSMTKESYMTWEEPFNNVWSVYRYANKSETVNEASLMCKNYKLIQYNERLERKNEELISINKTLETERDQYKGMLEKISFIIQQYKDKNFEERT